MTISISKKAGVLIALFITLSMTTGCEKSPEETPSQDSTKGWTQTSVVHKLEMLNLRVKPDPEQKKFGQIHWNIEWEHPLARRDEIRTTSYVVSKGNVSAYLFVGIYESEKDAMDAMAEVTKGKNKERATRMNLGATRDKNAVFASFALDPLPLVSKNTSHVAFAMKVLESLSGTAPKVNAMDGIEARLNAPKSKPDAQDAAQDMKPAVDAQ